MININNIYKNNLNFYGMFNKYKKINQLYNNNINIIIMIIIVMKIVIININIKIIII